MSVTSLINDLKEIIPLIEKEVKMRVQEFRNNFCDDETIFKEMCFCILTANFSAEKSITIQEKIGDGFIKWKKEKLACFLKKLGHRYYNTRASYIVYNRKYIKGLKRLLESFSSGKEAREYLIKKMKGLGYKEGSHFLRNIGFFDVAIIDYHIINLLKRYEILLPQHVKTSSLTPKKYKEIEKILEEISQKVGIEVGVLDLFLWYMETKKVLK